MVRAAGFAAAAMATAVAGLLALFFGAVVLAVLAYAVGCTAVPFQKLHPGRMQTAATIAAGILAGALNVFLTFVALS